MAIDVGGVCQDMFLTFWEVAFTRLFDGGNLVVPALHGLSEVESLELLGKTTDTSSPAFSQCALPSRLCAPYF